MCLVGEQICLSVVVAELEGNGEMRVTYTEL